MNKLVKIANPYFRLGRFDKPIGGWLCFWPASYGLALSSNYGFIDPFWMGCTFIGAFMLRAGGCAANDIFDRKLDILVERTKTRPIASGEISVAKGWAFYALNMTPVPLMMYFGNPAMAIPILMIIPIGTAYPLAKRYLKNPQFVLGIAMNYNFVATYAFMAGQLDLHTLFVVGGMWCWTVLYDTIYAFQDLKCDKAAGNNSTAVAWEGKTDLIFDWLTIGMASSFAYAGYLAQLGPLYYPALAFTMWKFTQTWVGIDLTDSKTCAKSFVKNHQIGGYIFLALLLGKLSQKRKEKDEKVEIDKN